jgi:hypothetical protein
LHLLGSRALLTNLILILVENPQFLRFNFIMALYPVRYSSS